MLVMLTWLSHFARIAEYLYFSFRYLEHFEDVLRAALEN